MVHEARPVLPSFIAGFKMHGYTDVRFSSLLHNVRITPDTF